MRASLHPDLRVSGHTLVDSALGLQYTLTPDAAWVVARLLQENRIELLIASIARLKQLSNADAKQSVYALLGQLGEYGAVRIRRERTDDRSWLLWRVRWSWPARHKGTIFGLLGAAVHAYGYIFIPLQGSFIVAHAVFAASFPRTLVLLPLGLVASFILHEAGHTVAARYTKVPVVFLTNPGYLAMLYKRPTILKAQFIAGAGPFLAASVCCIAAFFCKSLLLQIFLAVTAVAHAMSLLPFFADGKTIWRHT